MHKRFLTGICVLLLIGSLAVAQTTARSSENDPRIKQWLEKFPKADLNNDGILTLEEAREYRNANIDKFKKNRDRMAGQPASSIAPTHENIRYGEHSRNLLDFFQAKSDAPTPVLIYFHGGGFVAGDKDKIRGKELLLQCLDNGISVVAANYRFVRGENSEPFPGPMKDGARVIQFVRSKAEEWHLNPEKIVLSGGSAGGCMSVWLAVHDDLANPDSQDLVEKNSTRVSGVIGYGAQTFLNPELILKYIGGNPAIHPSLPPFYGLDSLEDLNKPEIKALIHEATALNHVSPDDPPLYLRYGGTLAGTPLPENAPTSKSIHHAMFGKVIQDKYKELGLTCDVIADDLPQTRDELEFLNSCFADKKH